ncbi:transient receptor potential cation channel subfamily A member 1 homolog [Pecten maximus]|uniref:transient receptor potential cation channel subfamily A member 1 homolog n=1 Tax=Pecten maximus TaxID=6579 RepID=UPI001458D57F|nr:transient receptor potential cation channel subfamily A member 1 homolog [Pecten maximus]XP_033741696.1 transient receptor potential cation channel subfamily A member 1 homolog [Pecten maximus]
MDPTNGEAGQYRTLLSVEPTSNTDKGVVEMTGLLSNPASEGREEPIPPIKRSESGELLNFTLHQCARNGDVRSTQILISQIKSSAKNTFKKINVRDEDKITPLHYAARYNHKAVAKLLVDNGADPDSRDSENLTPLHYAARYRRQRQKTTDTDDEDDGPELPDSSPQDEGTQADNSVISYLVQNGADINKQDKYGQTPLHYAAMRGNEFAAKELMSYKEIDIEAIDMQSMTALHMAATHNQVEITKLLIDAGSPLRCLDDESSTPLHCACSEGNIDIVKLLFEAGTQRDGWVTVSNMVTDRDCDQSTCLHMAVENGHYDVVKLCLEKRADVNTPASDYMNPIHLASKAGDIKCVKLLVEHHARIDALNDVQATPLHIACAFNHVDVVEYLIERGANLEKKDKDNYTPLLMAAAYGHADIIKLLLRKRVDYEAVEKSDKTAIFLAAEEDNLDALKALLAVGRVRRLVNVGDRYDNTPLHIGAEKGYLSIVKCLLEYKVDVDAKNEEEQTPLHLAAKSGRTNIVRELVLRDHSSVNDEDEDSNTALHLAADCGHAKVAGVLLDNGADVAARNCNLWTPLDSAAAKGWVKTCKVLLEADAPINPMDKTKTTPLHLAARYGHPGVVELLIKWKANIQQNDSNSDNCLDLAIDNNHPDVALTIINSEMWEDALRNETSELGTFVMSTPMRKLIKKMPDVAEAVFNKCMTDNKKSFEHPDYKVTFNYEFLDDVYSLATWRETGPSESGGSSGGSVYNEDFTLSSSAKPYTTDSSEMKKNHPLMIMVTSKREDLLAHPLVTSLLRHKWNSFGRVFYYINFFIYAIFLTFLTGYILSSNAPFTYSETGNVSCELVASSTTPVHEQHIFAKIGKYVIIALSAWNLLRELLQIYQAKLQYLGWENFIEWLTYVFALLLVIDFQECQRSTGYRFDWQWSLGAIAIFLAWIDLVLFLQKFPRFGIYVVMFKDILNTFIQFFVVFFLFIVAFALGFYTVLQNQVPFKTFGQALVKTSVMMIGEFEFDGIFNGNHADHTEKVYQETVTYILFVVFMIIMSIIIMNLLVGLAVDDIKAVQEQAALKRMAMQVELALDVERIVPEFIRRKFVTKKQTIKPNQGLKNPFSRLANLEAGDLSSAAINKALNPDLDDIEKVQEGQEQLQKDINKLRFSVKEMRSQNTKLEGMLTALLTSQDIKWQEEDFQDTEAS